MTSTQRLGIYMLIGVLLVGVAVGYLIAQVIR